MKILLYRKEWEWVVRQVRQHNDEKYYPIADSIQTEVRYYLPSDLVEMDLQDEFIDAYELETLERMGLSV